MKVNFQCGSFYWSAFQVQYVGPYVMEPQQDRILTHTLALNSFSCGVTLDSLTLMNQTRNTFHPTNPIILQRWMMKNPRRQTEGTAGCRLYSAKPLLLISNSDLKIKSSYLHCYKINTTKLGHLGIDYFIYSFNSSGRLSINSLPVPHPQVLLH